MNARRFLIFSISFLLFAGNLIQATAADSAGAAANGQFHFAPQLGTGKIFAANTNGFGRITLEAFQTNRVLILQPWARVHGRLVKDGKPVAGENVDLSWGAADFNGWPLLNLHGALTDENGRFTIDFVPPGCMGVSTRVPFGSADQRSWSSQTQKQFTARPGEDVDLGDVVKVDPMQ
jgi:hypothetical protein